MRPLEAANAFFIPSGLWVRHPYAHAKVSAQRGATRQATRQRSPGEDPGACNVPPTGSFMCAVMTIYHRYGTSTDALAIYISRASCTQRSIGLQFSSSLWRDHNHSLSGSLVARNPLFLLSGSLGTRNHLFVEISFSVWNNL